MRNPNRSDESHLNYKFSFALEPNHSLFFTLPVSAGYLLAYVTFFSLFSLSPNLPFSPHSRMSAVTDENVAPVNGTVRSLNSAEPPDLAGLVSVSDAAAAAEVLVRANTVLMNDEIRRAVRGPAATLLELTPEPLLAESVAAESWNLRMYRNGGYSSERRIVLANAMQSIFDHMGRSGFARQAAIASSAMWRAMRPRQVMSERIGPVIFHRPIPRPRTPSAATPEAASALVPNPETPANSPEETAQLPVSPDHPDGDYFV